MIFLVLIGGSVAFSDAESQSGYQFILFFTPLMYTNTGGAFSRIMNLISQFGGSPRQQRRTFPSLPSLPGPNDDEDDDDDDDNDDNDDDDNDDDNDDDD